MVVLQKLKNISSKNKDLRKKLHLVQVRGFFFFYFFLDWGNLYKLNIHRNFVPNELLFDLVMKKIVFYYQ
jgi:hypothetical protein